jgi:sec-independent protein translocase protein TatA
MGRFEEILVVLVIFIFLFGSTKLPGLGKAIGEFMNEFKKASSGMGSKDTTDPKKVEDAELVEASPRPRKALPPSASEAARKRRKAKAKAPVRKKKAKTSR